MGRSSPILTQNCQLTIFHWLFVFPRVLIKIRPSCARASPSETDARVAAHATETITAGHSNLRVLTIQLLKISKEPLMKGLRAPHLKPMIVAVIKKLGFCGLQITQTILLWEAKRTSQTKTAARRGFLLKRMADPKIPTSELQHFGGTAADGWNPAVLNPTVCGKAGWPTIVAWVMGWNMCWLATPSNPRKVAADAQSAISEDVDGVFDYLLFVSLVLTRHAANFKGYGLMFPLTKSHSWNVYVWCWKRRDSESKGKHRKTWTNGKAGQSTSLQRVSFCCQLRLSQQWDHTSLWPDLLSAVPHGTKVSRRCLFLRCSWCFFLPGIVCTFLIALLIVFLKFLGKSYLKGDPLETYGNPARNWRVCCATLATSVGWSPSWAAEGCHVWCWNLGSELLGVKVVLWFDLLGRKLGSKRSWVESYSI